MTLRDRLTPRALVYDVETRPLIAMTWQSRGDMYLGPDQLFDDGGVMAWSAQWLGEKKIRWASDHHDGHDDMVAQLHALLSEAEVVLGFNHERFDNPAMHSEFEAAGLPALPPTPQIDLLKVARRNFKMPHYKLAYLAQRFGLTDKITNDGWRLWRACITDPTDGRPYFGPIPKGGGCPKAWRKMRAYGRQDTGTTTELYWHLRDGGWIRKHPHVGLFGGPLDGCPACGSSNRTQVKDIPTATTSYTGYRCDDCNHLYRMAARTSPATMTRSV